MTAENFFLNYNSLKSEYELLFDLDGTLLDTNLANSEAYKYALWKVTETSDYHELMNIRRITRQDIATLPNISPEMLNNIIQLKKRVFVYKIRDGYTSPFITEEILKLHYLDTRCCVITSADKMRAQQLIEYYRLDKYVKQFIFTDDDDKYKDISSKLGVDASKIILFEDNKVAIESAINHGINENLIINVQTDTLRKHTILHNVFLSKDTQAYYGLDYMRFGHPENPDFI
ncbi:MAG: HAD family phosphatase, partial [Paludibacteraceae bacterium]|nr:HAD family phosphatase [Paludibacteraceae bacterium]